MVLSLKLKFAETKPYFRAENFETNQFLKSHVTYFILKKLEEII